MYRIFFIALLFLQLSFLSYSQNVGIGTSSPKARLHVADSSVVFTAGDPFLSVTPPVPVSGTGARMLWYAGKASFRVGFIDGLQWDKDSIGTFSFASGYNTKAKNLYSTALGRSTIANGTSSLAAGYFSEANGSNSMALGSYSIATGDVATALGSNTLSSGFASTAMGFATYAKGDYSTVMGVNTKARSNQSLVIGVYNDTTKLNSLFEIGNGTQDYARNNAMTVLLNGNTGIGTSSPTARLHVIDSSVVFTGPAIPNDATAFGPPVTGSGTRMMWYAAKGAFRAGTISGSGWDKANIGVNSFAVGSENTARGQYSSSLGMFNSGLGDYSFTAGYGNYVPGEYGVAIGKSNRVEALSGVAIGSDNQSWAPYSFTAGLYNIANGYSSFAMGQANRAENYGSVAMGDNATSIGQVSLSFGRGTITKGNYSIALGYGSEVRGDVGFVSGRELIVKSAYCAGFGIYNDTSDVPTPVFPAPTDRLFQIGNGLYSARSNALTVLHNGNTGIGVLNPVTKLEVAGSNNWDLSNTEGDFRIGNSSYRIKMGIALAGGGAGAASIRSAGGIERLNLGAGNATLLTLNGASGRVGIGTEGPSEKLEVIGNVRATAFITSSDARLKKQIAPLRESLPLLLKLNGYNYYWKDESIDSTRQIGLIAQEVKELFPDLVKENAEGKLAVNYVGLIPVLIESIKSQQQQIEELRKLVEQLMKK